MATPPYTPAWRGAPLFFGAQHLAVVRLEGNEDKVQRIAYRDIEAISAQRTHTSQVIAACLVAVGLLGGAALYVLLAVVTGPAFGEDVLFALGWACAFGLFGALMLARGATAKVCLHTRVGSVTLPGPLVSYAHVRGALVDLRRRVEEAQGGTVNPAVRAEAPPKAASAATNHGLQIAALPLRTWGERGHEFFFWGMVALGVLIASDLAFVSGPKTLLLRLVAAGVLATGFAALIAQRGTRLPPDLRFWTLAATVLMGAHWYFLDQTFNPWESAMVGQGGPWMGGPLNDGLLVYIGLCAVIYICVGAAGLVLLYRDRTRMRRVG